jgi:hypothetical protein
MRMTPRTPVARLMLAALAGLAVAACSDAKNDRDGALPTDAGAGLYPSMSVATQHGTATAQLSLRQVPGGTRFGSYQGEVVFDPAVLTFQSAVLPQGVEGAANLSAPGHVRFVGMALDGTEGAPLLTLRFAAKGQVAKEAFQVSFEEVTQADDYADLTSLVKAGTLLYSSR